MIRNFTRKISAILRVIRKSMLSIELVLYQQVKRNIPISLKIEEETRSQGKRAKLWFHPQFLQVTRDQFAVFSDSGDITGETA